MQPSWPVFHSTLRNQRPSKEKRFEHTGKSPGLGVSGSILESWLCDLQQIPPPFWAPMIPSLDWWDWTILPLMSFEHRYLTCVLGLVPNFKGPGRDSNPKRWSVRSEVVSGRRFPDMHPGPTRVASPRLFRCRIHSLGHSFNSIYRASGATGFEFECYDF